MKRFFIILAIASICFLAGVAVGRFVMPRKVEITVVDIKDLVEIIERYNEAKHELEKIKLWNEDAIIEPEPEEEEK
ncbi:unnamed protein product [marine sediment metagenome]|uniref:Uncharacterized protein n=1 Tax=marine sediment metagenome TaxID=412755 RepID=X1FWL3_9ZZZZ